MTPNTSARAAFLSSDNIVLAQFDHPRDRGRTPVDAFVRAAANGRGQISAAEPLTRLANPPTWWRVELRLHQGIVVVRNVLMRPSAQHILQNGWFETGDNGDEFAVGYDSIATVNITGHTGPAPGDAS